MDSDKSEQMQCAEPNDDFTFSIYLLNRSIFRCQRNEITFSYAHSIQIYQNQWNFSIIRRNWQV